MKKHIFFVVTLLLLLASASWAASISCSVDDATANGSTADSCFGDDWAGYGNNNPSTEASYVNSVFDTSGGLFEYATKYDNGGTSEAGLTGWSLNVATTTSGSYHFSYTLDAPDSYGAEPINFVLGIKQAHNSFIAYLFKDVTLDANGFFNSEWTNPAGNTSIAYSHAIAFIQPSSTVPEPATFILLGSGLAGLAFYRRKRK